MWRFSVSEAEAKERDLVECLRLIEKGGGKVRENKDFAMHRAGGRVGPNIQLFPNMYVHYTTIHHPYTTCQPKDKNNSLSNIWEKPPNQELPKTFW